MNKKYMSLLTLSALFVGQFAYATDPACLNQLDKIVAHSTSLGLGQSLQETASSAASTVDSLMARFESNLSQNFEQKLNQLVSGLRDASRKGGAIATSSQDRLDSVKADFINNCVK